MESSGSSMETESDEMMTDEEDDELEIDILILMLLACVECYKATYLNKQPVHDLTYSGNQLVHDMMHGHWRLCYDMCRMMPPVYVKLCNILREKGLAQSSRNVSVEEQVRIFLQTIGHNDRNRSVQHTLKHSGETISRYFNKILDACCAWAVEMIRPKDSLNSIPEHVRSYGGGKYYPFFKDCVGAIDGTHVHACVNTERQLAFRSGRSKTTTQNVMAVSDFNMRFTFLSAGWEGTAHDAKVLAHAVYNPEHNFPHSPQDKYYVVDAGYPNRKGFMAPYRNTRYHLPDFRRSAPRGREEHFNSLHSSLRNVIERSFGVWKKRWPILDKMPNYPYDTQVKIVIASMVIHNFIVEQRLEDSLIHEFDEDTVDVEHEHMSSSDPPRVQTIDDGAMSGLRDSIRDAIADARGLQ